MQTIVLKYGGTSLGSINRVKEVAKQVASQHDKGQRVVVVTSAMGRTTDELVEKAKAVNNEPQGRELSMLLSTGELVSSSLLSLALQALGKRSVSLTGGQSGIRANGKFDCARISDIETVRITRLLDQGQIVVVAGYQGCLGR